MNKVIVRLNNGEIRKGTTADFVPGKDSFHVSILNAPPGAKSIEIFAKDMKALFFVKDFEGNQQHVKRNEFDPEHPIRGRRIRVVFKDNEVLIGITTGYAPGRPGLFVIPADADSNNERCYVMAAATQEIEFI